MKYTLSAIVFPNMTRRVVAKVALLLGALALASSAFGAAFTTRVDQILLYEAGDLAYVYVEGGTQQPPPCAGSNGDYLSFSMARPRAKEYLAMLMLAFAMGKPVTFVTKGACIDQSVSDTIDIIRVNNQ
jgi:hypothetical protein